MFLISVLLIGLIVVAIKNEQEFNSASQAELVPIRVVDGQVETQKTKVQ